MGVSDVGGRARRAATASSTIASVREPMVRVAILAPKDYVGTIMELCQSRRGSLLGMEYLGERVELRYAMPLAKSSSTFSTT